MKRLIVMVMLVLNVGALAVESTDAPSKTSAPGMALQPSAQTLLPEGMVAQLVRSSEYQAKRQSLQAAAVAYQQALEKNAEWKALEEEAQKARARMLETVKKQHEFKERNKEKFTAERRALDQAQMEMQALIQKALPTMRGLPTKSPSALVVSPSVAP